LGRGGFLGGGGSDCCLSEQYAGCCRLDHGLGLRGGHCGRHGHRSGVPRVCDVVPEVGTLLKLGQKVCDNWWKVRLDILSAAVLHAW